MEIIIIYVTTASILVSTILALLIKKGIKENIKRFIFLYIILLIISSFFSKVILLIDPHGLITELNYKQQVIYGYKNFGLYEKLYNGIVITTFPPLPEPETERHYYMINEDGGLQRGPEYRSLQDIVRALLNPRTRNVQKFGDEIIYMDYNDESIYTLYRYDISNEKIVSSVVFDRDDNNKSITNMISHNNHFYAITGSQSIVKYDENGRIVKSVPLSSRVYWGSGRALMIDNDNIYFSVEDDNTYRIYKVDLETLEHDDLVFEKYLADGNVLDINNNRIYMQYIDTVEKKQLFKISEKYYFSTFYIYNLEDKEITKIETLFTEYVKSTH